jgi:hypothetical protein
MTDRYPPLRQREALLKFVEALGCRDAALRRDENSDWRIKGKHGWIYAVPGTLDRPETEGFLIYYSGPEHIGSARGWTFAKRAFEGFGCVTTQDGDDEGIVFLDRLPTAAEAEIIRDKLRITKKREISDAELERLRALSEAHRPRRDVVADEISGEKPASDDPAGGMEPRGPGDR